MSWSTSESSGARPALTADTELRRLSARDRIQLCQMLDTGDAWKQLAAVIPKPDDTDRYLITGGDILVLEQQKHIPGGSPAQALLDYWGTSGRRRPTIGLFVQLLDNCRLYRASNFVRNEVLAGALPSVHCEDSCDRKLFNQDCDNHISCDNSGRSQTSESINNLSTKLMTSLIAESIDKNLAENCPLTPTAPNKSLLTISDGEPTLSRDATGEQELSLGDAVIKIAYEQLSRATEDFSDTSITMGGPKIGEGAFGAVYRCRLSADGEYFAVKRLKRDLQKQFMAELRVMVKFRHENLLSVRGVSSDGPSLCIIYEYMANGSLLDCIARLDDRPPILWPTRLAIALGTARGIVHLHTFDEKPYVHRDIKSANILIDQNHTPRVGDFGLVRVGSSGSSTATNALTTTIIGTSVYMAPEAFRGDISVKLDTFSFGVVLLELLTGLSPYDQNRDEPDLLSYLEEKINDNEEEEDSLSVINTLIDGSAGDWNMDAVNELYELSRKCTEQRKKYRPTMVEVLQTLEKTSSLYI